MSRAPLRSAFRRFDLRLSVTRDRAGDGITELAWQGKRKRGRVPAAKLIGPSAISAVLDSLPWGSELDAWKLQTVPQGGGPATPIRRVTLDIADPTLAALPWESNIAPRVANIYKRRSGRIVRNAKDPIVRVSAVRPRSSDPFTLPLRIVQISPVPQHPIDQWVKLVFGRTRASEVADAVRVRAYELAEFTAQTWGSSRKWPTAEVLQFDAFPLAGDRLLSTAYPTTPGTLGWLSRVTDIWQTRLVIIHCPGEGQARSARELAAGLVARGGPAVLVGDFVNSGRGAAFYRIFYDKLIHDFPLDLNLSESLASEPAATGTANRLPSLFAGGGREERVRVSLVGERLLERSKEITAQLTMRSRGRRETSRPAARSRAERKDGSHLHEHPRPRSRRFGWGGASSGATRPHAISGARLTTHFSALKTVWPTLAFQFHESEGLLPLSRRLREVRYTAGIKGPAPTSTIEQPHRPRFVNAAVLRDGPDGALDLVRQKKARLIAGETYHLSIHLGRKDMRVRTESAVAIVEEYFKWNRDRKGVWVEIAVTGIDFDVIGDPVQELWLPRSGDSDAVQFAIVPRVDGVGVLRFSLYHEQNVLQSFRFAAVTQRAGKRAVTLAHPQVRMARLLNMAESRVGDAGYLARMEYSIGDPTRPPQSVRPAVSFVVNHVEDRRVVTVKGADLFGALVEENGGIDDEVQSVRETLDAIALPPIPRLAREKWIYGFGLPGRPNGGEGATLKQALQKLAETGSNLYFALMSKSDREQLATLLEPGQGLIQVAHVLIGDVIPWAVVYDRLYTEQKKKDARGVRIDTDACLASLPNAQGEFPVKRCGTHPDCPLHPAQLAKRLKEKDSIVVDETVACPLHFWGFRHVIEIPPQQVAKVGETMVPPSDRVLAAPPPVRLAAGLNASLRFYDTHLTELDTLTQAPKVSAAWNSKSSDRDAILEGLLKADLDVIYFYCHARGGLAEPDIKRPFLEFQNKNDAQAGKIFSKELADGAVWSHHPLVFLNGCGTVGFSPDALSPFVRALVRDRGASGVVGTEIPVNEELAREFALLFLRRFLAGEPAGSALLAARRALLSDGNPLGLVYTLYASASLVLG